MGFIIFKILRSTLVAVTLISVKNMYVCVCVRARACVIERSLSCFCDYDAEVLYESGKNACCSSEASKGKGKAIPVEVWTGSEGSRRLRLSDFMTTSK
jgi:hypothetical protein